MRSWVVCLGSGFVTMPSRWARTLPALFLFAACDPGVPEGDTDPDSDTVDVDTSDADTADVDTTDTDSDTLPPTPVDYSVPGGRALTEATGSLSLTDCTLTYKTYTPSEGTSAPLVVLGHGFSRSADNMTDVARYIASHGVRVVTPSYCFSGFLNADHERNGQDAAALSAALAGGADVVHMGHSAGGLSAVVAAGLDPLTIGVMGLDLTDNDTIAASLAPALDVPLYGVVGDGSQCNSSNNGVAVYEAADADAVRIPGATHCDFEGPTGIACTAFCGGENAEARDVVRTLAAAYAASVTGIDPGAASWLGPGGVAFDALAAQGLVAPL